ncbi:MAG: alpha-glucan family phosphorylase [Gammaproteobacteria bacterium]
MTIIRHNLEIQPLIPENLGRLTELANDLYYSWDRYSRGLFYTLDRDLWEECRHNPRVFLRRISQDRLEQASNDKVFLDEYHQTLNAYDAYLEEIRHTHFGNRLNPEKELIAYFCAEFGLHESLPVYSGGLGILAGDYCKSASDLGLPFIAVGLLYRHGNFIQTIDDNGHQIIHQIPVVLDDLIITPAKTMAGEDMIVSIPLAQTTIFIKVWQARVGRTLLYLLDTDLDKNPPVDRIITGDLYPHDRLTRLKQEIILGIGGVRAINQLGLTPTIWHINEGHPCLLLLERWCKLIDQGMDFHAARELAAANTIFTTHTPITAGHEVYEPVVLREYLSPFLQKFGVDDKYFFEMGENEYGQGFDFTSFSLRCSGFHNGVSREHGGVAANMEKHIWPDVPVRESPITHVTNGVHVPTFIAREWRELFNDPGWQNRLLEPEYWQFIDRIPDNIYWSVHLNLKANFIRNCFKLISQRCLRHGQGESQVNCYMELFRKHDDVMIIGFARRFATYKRADLIFEDTERLKRILDNPARPVVLLFAGKAHPNDEQGKQLIQRIHAISQQQEFIGKVILLEGYDMALARKLVTSVDLWLNTPEYPMEACGTSGMKAAINGVVNLSVLDGWWAEGYNRNNGWGVHPHTQAEDPEQRRRLEAQDLLDLLEHEIIPMYFDKTDGYSERWVKVSKESMKSIIPQFNSHRMVMDYINKLYLPALTISEKLKAEHGLKASELAAWKHKVNRLWPGIVLKRLDESTTSIKHGDTLTVRVAVGLNGLDSNDILVECLVGKITEEGDFTGISCYALKLAQQQPDNEVIYATEFIPEMSGLIAYEIRAYPYHPLLAHPLATGHMKWL